MQMSKGIEIAGLSIEKGDLLLVDGTNMLIMDGINMQSGCGAYLLSGTLVPAEYQMVQVSGGQLDSGAFMSANIKNGRVLSFETGDLRSRRPPQPRVHLVQSGTLTVCLHPTYRS
jgi:hypothetical protein